MLYGTAIRGGVYGHSREIEELEARVTLEQSMQLLEKHIWASCQVIDLLRYYVHTYSTLPNPKTTCCLPAQGKQVLP